MMHMYSMITIAAMLVIAPVLSIAADVNVMAQPITNCPPGTHVELIAQDFTCVRDIPGQERAQTIPPVNPNQEPCVGCVNEPSPGISGLKKDQSAANQYQGPPQVKPGEGPTDEQHCIGCEPSPGADMEDTNIPELKK